ncbi:DUF5683 domain-containing protein [Pontibacter anaerobius]|uniref:DUF5683 domain-containing protein n=1 Tax=Pontibacter anaerobius TaxID=2993940 RepID=A0ABT3RJE4_9BACT|nr:DUF5683 domain-containing protein [Pontibacter anaerobius]MCX2741618.1 DUF5683 domain-containing protein [Pontibacter anaerobius]
MRKVGAVAWLLGMVLYFAPAQTQGQVITAGPDSVRVPVPPDTAEQQRGFFLSKWDKPAKAALFSAIIPGAGQVYNKAYWKVPIVYATGAVLTYFFIDNNDKFQDYRVALLRRTDNDSTTVDQYANHPILGVQNGTNAVSNLRYRRDYYRRNRDLTIILSVAAYTLQIAEAYVHAHLKDFEVSEDLALRVQPNLLPLRNQPGTLTPGFTLTLYTRSK